MSLVLWMYIISIIGEVEMISGIIVWVFIFISVITLPVYAVTSDGFSDEIDSNILKYMKGFLLYILLPAIVLVTLLPNKNEMYIMAGLHYGEKALSSDKGNEILDKSYDALLANIEKSTKEALEEGE